MLSLLSVFAQFGPRGVELPRNEHMDLRNPRALSESMAPCSGDEEIESTKGEKITAHFETMCPEEVRCVRVSTRILDAMQNQTVQEYLRAFIYRSELKGRFPRLPGITTCAMSSSKPGCEKLCDGECYPIAYSQRASTGRVEFTASSGARASWTLQLPEAYACLEPGEQ